MTQPINGDKTSLAYRLEMVCLGQSNPNVLEFVLDNWRQIVAELRAGTRSADEEVKQTARHKEARSVILHAATMARARFNTEDAKELTEAAALLDEFWDDYMRLLREKQDRLIATASSATTALPMDFPLEVLRALLVWSGYEPSTSVLARAVDKWDAELRAILKAIEEGQTSPHRDLLDRAYKMMLMSGYRVSEQNPDHNNPIIAWMADARTALYGNGNEPDHVRDLVGVRTPATAICPACKRDRFKEPCPGFAADCPMTGGTFKCG